MIGLIRYYLTLYLTPLQSYIIYFLYRVYLDTHKRTFLKTISARVVATFTTAGVTFLLTGRLDFAITIGVADSLLKFFNYYLHERLWSRTRFGQIRKPQYEI